MNWYNIAENLGITLISFTLGVLLGAFVTFQITETVMDSNQTVLIEAIKKPSTAVNNDFDIKNKKGTLDLTNEVSDTIKQKNKWLKFLRK